MARNIWNKTSQSDQWVNGNATAGRHLRILSCSNKVRFIDLSELMLLRYQVKISNNRLGQLMSREN